MVECEDVFARCSIPDARVSIVGTRQDKVGLWSPFHRGDGVGVPSENVYLGVFIGQSVLWRRCRENVGEPKVCGECVQQLSAVPTCVRQVCFLQVAVAKDGPGEVSVGEVGVCQRAVLIERTPHRSTADIGTVQPDVVDARVIEPGTSQRYSAEVQMEAFRSDSPPAQVCIRQV